MPSSAVNQRKGNTVEPENADRIHVHSNSEESLVNISFEPATNATSASNNNANNNQNFVIVENPEPDIDIFLALQEEERPRDLNEGNTDNMEIAYRPRHPTHVFATGCRGLSPSIIQPPPPSVSEMTSGDVHLAAAGPELALNTTQLTSSTPLQSSVEWFFPEDDEGAELYDSELVSLIYNQETVETLAPNAGHLPAPALKLHVRYLEEALKDAMESPVPNIFPDEEAKHDSNRDGGTTSNPHRVSAKHSPPSRLSTRISSLAAEASESNISSWSLVEKLVEDFDDVDLAIAVESQNGSPGILSRAARALRVSSTPKKKEHPKTSEIYQIERISNNSLTQEPVILDITSTDEEFGFQPTLRTMPGAWPFVPADDNDEFPRSSRLDDMNSLPNIAECLES